MSLVGWSASRRPRAKRSGSGIVKNIANIGYNRIRPTLTRSRQSYGNTQSRGPTYGGMFPQTNLKMNQIANAPAPYYNPTPLVNYMSPGGGGGAGGGDEGDNNNFLQNIISGFKGITSPSNISSGFNAATSKFRNHFLFPQDINYSQIGNDISGLWNRGRETPGGMLGSNSWLGNLQALGQAFGTGLGIMDQPADWSQGNFNTKGWERGPQYPHMWAGRTGDIQGNTNPFSSGYGNVGTGLVPGGGRPKGGGGYGDTGFGYDYGQGQGDTGQGGDWESWMSELMGEGEYPEYPYQDPMEQAKEWANWQKGQRVNAVNSMIDQRISALGREQEAVPGYYERLRGQLGTTREAGLSGSTAALKGVGQSYTQSRLELSDMRDKYRNDAQSILMSRGMLNSGQADRVYKDIDNIIAKNVNSVMKEKNISVTDIEEGKASVQEAYTTALANAAKEEQDYLTDLESQVTGAETQRGQDTLNIDNEMSGYVPVMARQLQNDMYNMQVQRANDMYQQKLGTANFGLNAMAQQYGMQNRGGGGSSMSDYLNMMKFQENQRQFDMGHNLDMMKFQAGNQQGPDWGGFGSLYMGGMDDPNLMSNMASNPQLMSNMFGIPQEQLAQYFQSQQTPAWMGGGGGYSGFSGNYRPGMR